MKDYHSLSEIIDCKSLFKNLRSVTPERLNEILEDIKRYGYENQYKYTSILYPSLALNILALSRSSHWRGFGPDKLIEEIIAKYISEHCNIDNYERELFKAITDRDCLDGVYYRLNYMILLTNVMPDKTTVATKYGVYSHIEKIEPEAAPFYDLKTKEAIKEFLVEKDAYDDKIASVTGKIQKIYKEYDLEQSLLAWVGYIILRHRIDTTTKMSPQELPSCNIKNTKITKSIEFS